MQQVDSRRYDLSMARHAESSAERRTQRAVETEEHPAWRVVEAEEWRAERMAETEERRTRRMAEADARRCVARRQAITAGLLSLLWGFGMVSVTIVGFMLGWYNAATWIGPGFDIARDWPNCVAVGLTVAVVFNAIVIYCGRTESKSENNSR